MGRIASKESVAGFDEFYFFAQTNGILGSAIYDITGGSTDYFESKSATNLITLNTWQHVAATYDDTGDRKVRLYINGVEVSSYVIQEAVTGTLRRAPNPLILGNRAGGDRAFDGAIDDVRVYNRVLSPAEILALP